MWWWDDTGPRMLLCLHVGHGKGIAGILLLLVAWILLRVVWILLRVLVERAWRHSTAPIRTNDGAPTDHDFDAVPATALHSTGDLDRDFFPCREPDGRYVHLLEQRRHVGGRESEAADGSKGRAMKTLQTLTDPGMFRTDRLPAPPVRLDRKANVIFGASLMQVRNLNDAEVWPWTVCNTPTQ